MRSTRTSPDSRPSVVGGSGRHHGPPRSTVGFAHPIVHAGTPAEYAAWNARAQRFLRESGRDPADLERIDATISYSSNRILLFALLVPGEPYSVAETLAHEVLHALLDQLGERRAARALDYVSRPAGLPGRSGGI